MSPLLLSASHADTSAESVSHHAGRRVLRNPTTLRNVAVLVPCLVVMGLWSGKTPGLSFGGAALIALAGVWPRVVVDSGGLTVVNVLPRRLAWKDIAAVGWRHRWDRAGLFLVLADGRGLWAWGVLTNGYGYGWTVDATNEIEASWQAASDAADGSWSG
jgi:Bacterial PH domain